MKNFKLNREEISREIHHLLKESFPDRNIDGRAVTEFIAEFSETGRGLVFDIGGYCAIAGLETNKAVELLMYDLEIELEKNLHDKMLFDIRLNGDKIEFCEKREING